MFFVTVKEIELRYLRKTVKNQTQEVSALKKQIENINNGIYKLKSQNEQLRTDVSILKDHLIKIQNYVQSINEVLKLSGKFNFRIIKQISSVLDN